jgi:hypothetical protein
LGLVDRCAATDSSVSCEIRTDGPLKHGGVAS